VTDGADGRPTRKSKSQGGRPSTYTSELAGEICLRLAEGESLREICRDDGMPAESTVRGWALDNVDGFFAPYSRARRLQAETWADEIVEIAEDGRNDWTTRRNKDGSTAVVLDREHVQRSALRVDARKWLLAKLHPETWGERVHNVLTGKDGGPIETHSTIGDPNARIRELLAKMRGQGPPDA
jgi:hypothetical protein